MDLLPKLQLELIVPDEIAADVVSAIRAGAVTGKIGDGTIWVTDSQRIVRIRTGEEGLDAIR